MSFHSTDCQLQRVFMVALFLFSITAPSLDAFRAPENPINVKIPSTLTKSKQPTLLPDVTTVGPSTNVPPLLPTTTTTSVVDAEALTQVGRAVAQSRDATFHAKSRKRWGIDHAESGEYWFDSRIHTFGNIGLGGAFHAALAPISTKLIDMIAYDGVDVRAQVALDLAENMSKNSKLAGAKVLDMACGVGISTRALRDAFPDAEKIIGLDTSAEMISMANFLSQHLGFFKPFVTMFEKGLSRLGCTGRSRAAFKVGNAENTSFDDQSFDIVTIMYAFHEAPKEGRDRILREAYRLLQPGGTLAVVDICTEYTPSDTMLAGEPYVIEYQKNIHHQLKTMKGFSNVKYQTIIPKHVGMWTLSRSAIKV